MIFCVSLQFCKEIHLLRCLPLIKLVVMSTNLMVVVIRVDWVPVEKQVYNGALVLAKVVHQV
jgi:hypothetical protein